MVLTTDDYLYIHGVRGNAYVKKKYVLLASSWFLLGFIYRGVAQLVARLLWEQDAAGSNPVTPTWINM